MPELEANVEMFLAVAVLGIAAILAVVGFMSFRRLRHPRALFIALGFLAFAVKGGYLVQRAYEIRGTEGWLTTVAMFDLVILVFLYLALRVR